MRVIVLRVAAALAVTGVAWAGGLADLAANGRWEKVLEVARLREAQLPLGPGEALIAAEAARRLGRPGQEARYLAMVPSDAAVGQVAAVRRARLELQKKPDRAAESVVGILRGTTTSALRREAVSVAAAALERGIPAATAGRVASAAARLPRRERRRLQSALAVTSPAMHRSLLRRLLERSVADLPALDAARALSGLPSARPKELWLAAQAYFRHAAYREAIPILERLAGRQHSGVAQWRVLFLRGRCSFRRDQWEAAASWYRRSLQRAPSRERRAELTVHLARALELGGDPKGALSAARRAVRTRATDDRRLFLLRLLLKSGDRGSAKRVRRSLRTRSARERARILCAVRAHADGRPADAARELQAVRRRPWRGPASTVAGSLALAAGDSDGAVALLERAAAARPSFFWGELARELLGRADPHSISAWRGRRRTQLDAAPDRRVARELVRWAILEIDPEEEGRLRARAALQLGLDGDPSHRWPGRLARALWDAGLGAAAARWDPAGFPGSTAAAAAWSAPRLLNAGAPRWALRRAAAVRDRLGAGTPPRLLPAEVLKALFPLPDPPELRRAARAAGVPASLLAALVREESRWDPSALSVVGARGLTQLMPATAVAVAAAAGEPPAAEDDLFEPAVSLRLGATEVARLLAAFQGRRPPAIAAYNAGEAQARLWLDDCGRGCTDEWYLLTVTFGVTRRYTADVLAGARLYAELYDTPDRGRPAVTAAGRSPPAVPGQAPTSARSPR